jgi:hypothetical protein
MFVRSYIDCNKRFAFFLLFLLFWVLVAFSHHHDCIVDDRECQICIVIKHQCASSPVAVAFDDAPYLTGTALITSTLAFIETLSFSSRSKGVPASITYLHTGNTERNILHNTQHGESIIILDMLRGE